MKILLYANTDWFMFNFNRAMALYLRDNGHDVLMVTPPGLYSEELGRLGFRWFAAPMQRRSLNPLKELFLLVWLFRLFKIEKPDVVHNFTLKCVLQGSIAARFANVGRCINELTGLGYVFTSNSFKASVLRRMVLFLFRFVLTGKNYSLLLLNRIDFNLFERLNIIPKQCMHLILGAGVDCIHYSPYDKPKNDSFRVALPARMLWDKGVSEFVEASRLLKSEGRDIEFWLVGNSDAGNPTSINEVILREWTDSGLVKWLGHVADMREIYREVNAVVLPSYREGLPTSLTEAAACGLPLIASNVPGCVDVVVPGVNGYLVPVRNAVELSSAIANLSDDRLLCIRYGLASREMALARFDKRVIFEQRLQIYLDRLPQSSCTDAYR